MSFILLFIFLALIALFSPRAAHAIIFLPALILVPIAKIVAIILSALSLPAIGLGTMWSVLFKKSLKRTLFIVGALLIIVAFILIIFLKMHNPARPLF